MLENGGKRCNHCRNSPTLRLRQDSLLNSCPILCELVHLKSICALSANASCVFALGLGIAWGGKQRGRLANGLADG